MVIGGQRDVWLGQDGKRTANAYEAFDPEYLRDSMQATESVIEKLQGHSQRRVFVGFGAISYAFVLRGAKAGHVSY